MTMTLQEARDWLVEVRKRNAVNASLDNMDDHDAEAVIQAIDAHLAADALLRKVSKWGRHGGIVDDEVLQQIDAHLQGAGDEA